jgi:hypothetical protein
LGLNGPRWQSFRELQQEAPIACSPSKQWQPALSIRVRQIVLALPGSMEASPPNDRGSSTVPIARGGSHRSHPVRSHRAAARLRTSR